MRISLIQTYKQYFWNSERRLTKYRTDLLECDHAKDRPGFYFLVLLLLNKYLKGGEGKFAFFLLQFLLCFFPVSYIMFII